MLMFLLDMVLKRLSFLSVLVVMLADLKYSLGAKASIVLVMVLLSLSLAATVMGCLAGHTMSVVRLAICSGVNAVPRV